jgi:hypothetical protein
MSANTLTTNFSSVSPYLVRQAMIDDGVLYIQLMDGSMQPVRTFEPVKETHYLSDGSPFPYTAGWVVTYDASEMAIATVMINSDDDTPLYVDHTPKVGMGATMVYPSDRYPYTVVDVLNLNTLVVQEDRITHISGNFRDGNAVWEIERNHQGAKLMLKFRKGYGWVTAVNRTPFTVGTRDYYQSPEI